MASDSEYDNVLRIQYDNRFIRVSVIKDEKAPDRATNMVRIRTNGSEYGTYYQEFLKFFRNLRVLHHNLFPEDYQTDMSENVSKDKKGKNSIFNIILKPKK